MRPSLTFEPLYYRPYGVGDWSGHVPFAADLMACVRPSVVVELGTYYGESYFTLCQAAAEFRLGSFCYAVDTWEGDSHTGAYGESVFERVSRHNEAHYRDFSTLIRATFDAALARFEDGAIDLLHIDGLHTYEAVRHDFETWFPKVSAGGIVLLHDTAVRRTDFGVWRLWEELKKEHEVFEFPHSSGLGVLRKAGGKASCSFTDELFQDLEKAEELRQFYRACGERLELREECRRLRRRGQWDLLLKAFWRDTSEDFAEERSIHLHDDLTNRLATYRIDLPANAVARQLRLDFLDCPAFLRMAGLRFHDKENREAVSNPFDRPEESLLCAGVRILNESEGSHILALTGEGEHSIVLTAPAHGDPTGGRIEVTLAGVEADEYSAIMAGLVEREKERASGVTRQVEELRRDISALTAGLAAAESLVRERDDEILRLSSGLAAAEALVRDRDEHITALSRGLADAEALVSERDEQLAQTRRELAGRERQLCEAAIASSELASQAARGESQLIETRQALDEARRFEPLYAATLERLRELERSPFQKFVRIFRRLVR